MSADPSDAVPPTPLSPTTGGPAMTRIAEAPVAALAALAAALFDGPIVIHLPEDAAKVAAALADRGYALVPVASVDDIARRIDEAHAFGYREGHRAALREALALDATPEPGGSE